MILMTPKVIALEENSWREVFLVGRRRKNERKEIKQEISSKKDSQNFIGIPFIAILHGRVAILPPRAGSHFS